MAYVVVVLIALLLAAAVLVLAARGQTSADRGEGPLRAFGRGLRGRRHPDARQQAEARAAAAQPVDLTLAEMLRATVEDGEGYLQPQELLGLRTSPSTSR
jgi:hypothetical protein